jgi:hypothetical protein
MPKLFRSMVMASAVVASASAASAGELKLSIANGRVTLVAQDVPVRQILAEWARVGRTTIVNGEKLVGAPLTLQLIDRPEREAIEVLLRSAAGYLISERAGGLPTGSVFDRIMILATSKAPAFSAGIPPPAFGNRPMPQPQPQPQPDDDEPVEPVPVPLTPPQGPPGSQMPGQPPMQPGQPPAPPMTAPRDAAVDTRRPADSFRHAESPARSEARRWSGWRAGRLGGRESRSKRHKVGASADARELESAP